MPRWPEGYVPRIKQTCPDCGGRKDFYATKCRGCTIPGKPLLGVKGTDHPSWKTGQRIDEDGYIKTYAPDHPWPRKGGYVFEHDRVMELKIGRRLLSDETVHHIDENKVNNSPDNLEILPRGEHARYHNLKNHQRRVRDDRGRFASGKEAQDASR